ncbi:MAG: hypothetical protein KJ042_12095, partial [Deltaproteobacteria bacterium]|nr:hypothetical protein [Deltaproteobacteria bacterium]
MSAKSATHAARIVVCTVLRIAAPEKTGTIGAEPRNGCNRIAAAKSARCARLRIGLKRMRQTSKAEIGGIFHRNLRVILP